MFVVLVGEVYDSFGLQFITLIFINVSTDLHFLDCEKFVHVNQSTSLINPLLLLTLCLGWCDVCSAAGGQYLTLVTALKCFASF